MSTILRVNAWKVEEEDGRFVITNFDHPEWNNIFKKDTCRYQYRYKRIPKTIDRVIKNAMGINDNLDDSDRTFGIEIECYHPNNHDIRRIAGEAIMRAGINCQVMNYTHRVISGWKITTDASIHGGTGLEVVSPILRGQDGIDQVKKVMKVLSDLGCRVNRSTGMHVHIGARDLNESQLHKCFEFYRDNETLFDSLVARSRRGSNNNYCASIVGLFNFSSSRYVKLNYQSFLKYGTLEFRQHQGSLNGDKAEHWIKLVRSVVEYCKSRRQVRTFSTVEDMVRSLGLESESGWYLERAEELAS